MAIKTKQAVSKPKLSTYISDFTLKFGPVSLRGLMSGVRESEAKTTPTFRLISPNGNAVEQKYIDVETKEAFAADDCDRYTEQAGEIVVMDNDTLKEIKKSLLPKNIMTLTVHPIAEVQNQIYHEKGQGYVFYPEEKDPANVKLYETFTAAIANSPDKAFIGVCNFHGHEGLFRVTVWRGRMVFQKQMYPGDLKAHEVVDFPLDNDAKVLRDIFEKRTEPFTADVYRNTVVERQREILADPSKLEVAGSVQPTESNISDLLASLADWE